MKTFKVTYFEKFDIFAVETYHNVKEQDDLCKYIAMNIVTFGLSPIVQCESDGVSYTEAVNHLLKHDIAEIDKDYARKWYETI